MGCYYLIFKMDLIGFLRSICTNGYSFPFGNEWQETLASLVVPCKNGTRASDGLELVYINGFDDSTRIGEIFMIWLLNVDILKMKISEYTMRQIIVTDGLSTQDLGIWNQSRRHTSGDGVSVVLFSRKR